MMSSRPLSLLSWLERNPAPEPKYRFINAYCTGEQDIRRKNENTDYIIFIDISKYEQEQQLLVNDEICF